MVNVLGAALFVVIVIAALGNLDQLYEAPVIYLLVVGGMLAGAAWLFRL